MRARTQEQPPHPTVYFSCLSLKWFQGPRLGVAMPLPVVARKGAEDSVIQGHSKEARTHLPQRAVMKMWTPRIQDQGKTPTQEAAPSTPCLYFQSKKIVWSLTEGQQTFWAKLGKFLCRRLGWDPAPFLPGWGAVRVTQPQLPHLSGHPHTHSRGLAFNSSVEELEASHRCRKEHQSIFLRSKQCCLI